MGLHPIKDGLVPHPDEKRVIKRDKGGNTLVDVVSPKTGFCVGVRSPLTSDCLSVRSAKSVSGGKGTDTRYDQRSGLWFDLERVPNSDPIGKVVRTVDMGDDKLPLARVKVKQSPKSEMSEKAKRAIRTRKENDVAVMALLAAMGYTGEITPQIRRAALEMIEMEKRISGKTD